MSASDRDCACWGPLIEGEIEHADCDVIVQHPGQCVSELRAGPFPRVCGCECTTCKRAWWRAGRPILREGAIVRESALDDAKRALEGVRDLKRPKTEILEASSVLQRILSSLTQSELEAFEKIEDAKPPTGRTS